MASTYGTQGVRRSPGPSFGMRSTGQEAFQPGGSADPERIGKGFLTNRRPPGAQSTDTGIVPGAKKPLPSYGGVNPGASDYARARDPGGVHTMDVTPWESARSREQGDRYLATGDQGIGGKKPSPYAPTEGVQGGPASDFAPGGKWGPKSPFENTAQPYRPPGTSPQMGQGFYAGNAGGTTPPQPNQSVQYQGTAQGGQTTAPAPQKPTWNPQGDASTWGTQYNTYNQQMNDYNNQQTTGKTREQAQAEIDALNGASGTDPEAALRRTAGGGNVADYERTRASFSPGGMNAQEKQRQQWMAGGGNAYADITRNQWSPAYADEYSKAFALGSPAPGVVGGNPPGMMRVGSEQNSWLIPDPRIQQQQMIDQGNDFAQRSQDIVSGAWIDPNLWPNAGPRRDVGAGPGGRGGGSFTTPMNPANGNPSMQPILSSGGFGTSQIPADSGAIAARPIRPTTPGGGGETTEPTPGFRETVPGVAPGTGAPGTPGVQRPDFLTNRTSTETIPPSSPSNPIALPDISEGGVTKGVKDYFLPTEKDEFETEAERLRKNYYVDVPGAYGAALEEAVGKGQGTDSGIFNRLLTRNMQERTGQLDRDMMQLATARAAARRQASQRLGEYGLSEASTRAREGFAARESALGRALTERMPGVEGDVQSKLTEQRYGLEGAEAEKNRGLTREQASLGRNLQREMLEKQTGAEKELIGARSGEQMALTQEQAAQQRENMREQTRLGRQSDLYQADYGAAVNAGDQYSQNSPQQIEQEISRVQSDRNLTQEQKLGFMAGLRKAQYDRGNVDYERQNAVADRDFQIYAQDWFTKGKEHVGRDLPPELLAEARRQGGVAEMLLTSGQSGGNFDVEFAKMQSGEGRFGSKTWFDKALDTTGKVLDLAGKGVSLASGIGGLTSGPKK